MRLAHVALVALVGGCGAGFRVVPTDGGTAPIDADTAIESVTGLDLPDGGTFRALWGSAPDDVHAVGDDGLMRDWDGQMWQVPTIGAGKDLTGVWGTGPHDVYAVGIDRTLASGYVLHRERRAGETADR